jgi:BirA family biotin operon repressor/biotin-[acetyl-CoA-carboxylase] ligase
MTMHSSPGEASSFSVQWVPSVTSTNDVALVLAEAGAREGFAIAAQVQTAGRGRRGRKWASPKGGLWASVILRPSIRPRDLGLLSIACALAAARAIEDETGLRPGLKWPNDIVLEGKKVGGVLLESKTARGKIEYVVAGVGLNANLKINQLPPSVRESATTLEDHLGQKVNLNALLASFLRRFAELCKCLGTGEHAQVLDAWKERDTLAGQRVAAAASRRIEGLCEGVDARGRLLIREESGRVVPCGQNARAVRLLE